MPRIPDEYLDCVIYLYPDEIAAEDGERAGGSGFLAGIHATDEAGTDLNNWIHLYVVSNSHVVGGGNFMLRLNDQNGAHKVYPTKREEWLHHPDGDDVAICSIPNLSQAIYKFKCLTLSTILTTDLLEKWAIGPGDTAFMIGRFINHEGKQKNLPSVRFGNIAQMPNEKIYQRERRFYQESFLVECRAIGGYSGSPVFVYVLPNEPWPPPKDVS